MNPQDARTKALTSVLDSLTNRFGAKRIDITPEQGQEAAIKWKRAGRQYSRSQARQFRAEVIQRCQGRCEICSDFQPWTLELHHVVPVKDGGEGWPQNLIALCPNCHAVLETLKSRVADDPKFHEWIRSKYGASGYEKFGKLLCHERIF